MLLQAGGGAQAHLEKPRPGARDPHELTHARFLSERGLARKTPTPGSIRLLVTDLPRSFGAQAARFLGEDTSDVQAIDL